MRKFIIIALLAGLIVPSTVLAEAKTFSDVPISHPNRVAISYLSDQGIINGYDDGTFKPGQLVNRAEALKIILEGVKAEIPATIIATDFSDVAPSDWFAKYVAAGKKLGIISGNPDGTYAPGRSVAKAEFLKILLNAHGFNPTKWQDKKIFNDVAADAWFTPFMNYAGQAGLITPDANNNLEPSKPLTRAEVAEIYYLMTVIKKGGDSQFLLNQAEAEMAQIEIYITAKDPISAKRSAELAVDMTQQAYKNLPDNKVVLGAAKLARAYDFLVNSYILALKKDRTGATDWANQAITKATEAWESNNDLQPICRHIKDRASEVIAQVTA